MLRGMASLSFTLERFCSEESLLSRYVNGLKVAFPTKHVTTVCRNEYPKSEVQIIDFTLRFENILISIFRVNNASIALSLIKNRFQKEVLKLCHRIASRVFIIHDFIFNVFYYKSFIEF